MRRPPISASSVRTRLATPAGVRLSRRAASAIDPLSITLMKHSSARVSIRYRWYLLNVPLSIFRFDWIGVRLSPAGDPPLGAPSARLELRRTRQAGGGHHDEASPQSFFAS